MPTKTKPPFSARLRSLIDADGRPIAKLAEESGLSRAIIYQLLDGKRPNPQWETICKLADALGKSTEEFR